MKLFIAGIMVAMAPAAALSAQDATTKPMKVKKAADPNKKSCRRGDDTGTIMPTSICHTSAEWARIDAEHRESSQAALNSRANAGLANSPTRP